MDWQPYNSFPKIRIPAAGGGVPDPGGAVQEGGAALLLRGGEGPEERTWAGPGQRCSGAVLRHCL